MPPTHIFIFCFQSPPQRISNGITMSTVQSTQYMNTIYTWYNTDVIYFYILIYFDITSWVLIGFLAWTSIVQRMMNLVTDDHIQTTPLPVKNDSSLDRCPDWKYTYISQIIVRLWNDLKPLCLDERCCNLWHHCTFNRECIKFPLISSSYTDKSCFLIWLFDSYSLENIWLFLQEKIYNGDFQHL